jgi:hypothetical protein
MCQKPLKGLEVGSHLEQCQSRICPQCNASVFARQYDKHLQTCTVVYCRICRKSNILLDEIKEHKERCSHRSRGLNTSIPLCDKQVTRTLLAPDTCFPISEAIKRTMKAWTEEPLNTIVADFEFFRHTNWDKSPSEFALFPLQIAMANANGEWIVPVTSINYGLPMRAMFDQGKSLPNNVDRYAWEGMLHKFYGNADIDAITPGMTWTDIANRIDNYVQVRIPQTPFDIVH